MSSPRILCTACRVAAPRNSSPTSAFLQQFRRCLSSNSAPAAPQSIPAFLVPSRNAQNHRASRTSQSSQVKSAFGISRRYALRQAPFSTTATRRATTTVTQNPQMDDDGNPQIVEICDRAAQRLREITEPTATDSPTQKENPYNHLRITVTSGGCHGFQYLMSLEGASKIDPEEDTVLEAELPEDAQAQQSSAAGQAKLVMDSASLELLSGSKVDYTTELIGSQFKIVDNPRATSSCGCGTSFDVVD